MSAVRKIRFPRAVRLIMLFLAVSLFLSACGKPEDFSAPFCDAGWDVTYDGLVSSLGEPEQSYVSVYSGVTYACPGKYLGKEGTLKYMFAEDGKLASIAWAFVGSDAEELKALFDQIDGAETEKHGKSQFSTGNPTSYGDVWYLKEGDIMISTIFGQDSCGLQYAYILRDYSKRK